MDEKAFQTFFVRRRLLLHAVTYLIFPAIWATSSQKHVPFCDVALGYTLGEFNITMENPEDSKPVFSQ